MSRIADRELSSPGGARLALRVYYPDGAGPFPLFLFSHGLGGSRIGYSYLGRALAAHGYVSIHPTHTESLQAKRAMLELQEDAQGAARLLALREMKAAIDDEQNWEARPRDVKLILDSLPALEGLIEPLKGKLDPARIGVGGHSYGAYTALLIAGARVQSGTGVRSFEDARPRAFVAMSPPGQGSRGLTHGSWAAITRPFLSITGTLDAGFAGQPPEWRLDAHRGIAARVNESVVLEGADHFTFSGGRPRKPANATHLRQIESSILGFLARTL